MNIWHAKKMFISMVATHNINKDEFWFFTVRPQEKASGGRHYPEPANWHDIIHFLCNSGRCCGIDLGTALQGVNNLQFHRPALGKAGNSRLENLNAWLPSPILSSSQLTFWLLFYFLDWRIFWTSKLVILDLITFEESSRCKNFGILIVNVRFDTKFTKITLVLPMYVRASQACDWST